MRATPVPVVRLTGERGQRRFTVIVDEDRIALTRKAFTTLIRLVIARGASETGLIRADVATVHRLRKALSKARVGQELIETGYSTEYRLAIPREQVSTHVILDESFFELEQVKVVAPKQMAQLRTLCATARR